jgi:hypothetical protein
MSDRLSMGRYRRVPFGDWGQFLFIGSPPKEEARAHGVYSPMATFRHPSPVAEEKQVNEGVLLTPVKHRAAKS